MLLMIAFWAVVSGICVLIGTETYRMLKGGLWGEGWGGLKSD
jgi:hypothetical protein